MQALTMKLAGLDRAEPAGPAEANVAPSLAPTVAAVTEFELDEADLEHVTGGLARIWHDTRTAGSDAPSRP